MKVPENPSRYWLQKEIEYYADKLPVDSMVLDAGGGMCAYKQHFTHCNYESADFAQMGLNYDKLSYICDLTKIPVDDNRYDFILFTQVMEHVPEPELVLYELLRILKPLGKIFCSAPVFYHEHGAPYDFYRYTYFGLKYLFSKVGFTIDKIERMEGFFQTSSYLLDYIRDNLPDDQFTAKNIFGQYAEKFRELEMKNKITDKGIPINYIVVATKL
ncbi:MAG: methyltransferase domain-containing protein [Chitinispirillales bacterium]|jgi:ubiquinone/menaquinone biosynthesis C-methylase UbiE|nr:methyltransferase domain-containing protein [Chitinispirillales bacterium]